MLIISDDHVSTGEGLGGDFRYEGLAEVGSVDLGGWARGGEEDGNAVAWSAAYFADREENILVVYCKALVSYQSLIWFQVAFSSAVLITLSTI